MFNRAREKVQEKLSLKPAFLGSLIENYHHSRSEKLAKAVVDNYFSGELPCDRQVEFGHTDSARQNCSGLNCQPLAGKIISRPFLSKNRRTLLVNLELSENHVIQLGLLTLDSQGWKPTGWEIKNKSEGVV